MPGNPNPSPETRFKPGNNANPGGKSKELKALEVEAATMAAKIRHAALSAMTEKLAKMAEAPDATPDEVLKLITADNLRLFKDSEDRAHGTPKQSVEQSGPNGGPIEVSADAAFATFARLVGGHGAAPGSGDPEAGGVGSEGTP
jgi:hypothetical protein